LAEAPDPRGQKAEVLIIHDAAIGIKAGTGIFGLVFLHHRKLVGSDPALRRRVRPMLHLVAGLRAAGADDPPDSLKTLD